MTEFKHIMLDLETMGVKSNSAILSIAAIPFNLETGEISDNQFYEKINLQSALDVGLKIQASTVYWWMQQNEEARNEFCKPANKIHFVLRNLEIFLNSFGSNFEIWGNGARFDMGLLQDAYHACGYDKLPWKFRNERDVRTLLSLAPHVKEQILKNNTLTKHIPINDCVIQIEYCYEIYKFLVNSNH